MAQRRRKEKQKKAADRKSLLLCIAGAVGAVALSLAICLIVFDIRPTTQASTTSVVTVLPYDAASPFSVSDLTPAQLTQIRQQGRMSVSDGPRGVSIGDPLEDVLDKYPSTFTEKLASSDSTQASVGQTPSAQAVSMDDEEMLQYCEENLDKLEDEDQTGMQSDEEIVLYCAEYFENQNGLMTALPPRGLLTVQGGNIVVTLLAPTAAYPPGTKDSYGSYEHVYCLYTIEPDTMTVSEIVLGIDR